MRLSIAALAALASLPVPVAAQDIGEEFPAAYRIFGHTMNDLDTALTAVADQIPTLAARYIRIVTYLGGGSTTPVEVDMEKFCGAIVSDLRQIGPRSFVMVQRNVGNPDILPYLTNYAHVGMNMFQRVADETAMLARFGFEDGRDPPASLYMNNSSMGVITLYNPSPNILVFVTDYGVAEYYARCPDTP
jgi:hypothetical protein